MSTCAKNQILRKGYTRKEYERTDGTKVEQARVKPACVSDVGKPGKTKSVDKVLPKLRDDIHLGTYGYFLDRTESDRRDALRKASKAVGDLKVLRRLNLIRNYSKWEETNYEKLSDDVEYLKTRYAGIKNRKSGSTRSRSTKSRSRSRSKK